MWRSQRPIPAQIPTCPSDPPHLILLWVGLQPDRHRSPLWNHRQTSHCRQLLQPRLRPHRFRLVELTDRLHRAIEREKSYPLSARRLGREGTAQVAFRLHPDGQIDELTVATTSGEPALDRAALRAVSGISPFAEAAGYLVEAAPFRVEIAFRLR